MIKKISIKAFCLIIASAVFIILGSAVKILAADLNSQEDLGDITHYNGFIFDYFQSNSGTNEGALAVGKDAVLGTSGQYDIGSAAAYPSIGSYQNPGRYPTLLLNGPPTIGSPHYSNINIYGGPAVINEELKNLYLSGNSFHLQNGNRVLYGNKDVMNSYFDQAYTTVKTTQLVLDNAYQKEGTAAVRLTDFIGWNTKPGLFSDLARFTPDNLTNTNGMRILLIEVSDSGNLEINGTQLTGSFESYDLIILHFPNAASARFTGASIMIDGTQINPNAAPGTSDGALLKSYSEKIVWNFPEALGIQIAGTGVIGSVIAPEAYVEGSGGSINGMLIADSYVTLGGFGLHAFALNPDLFNLKNPGDEPVLKGSLFVRKYDENAINPLLRGQVLLSGAKFELYQKNSSGSYVRYDDAVPYYETGSDGALQISELPKGSYFLQEAEAPYGYYLSGEKYYFTIDAAHGVEHPVILNIPNTRITASLTLQKTDADDPGLGLSGARFILYRINGRQIEIIAEPVSDENGYLQLDSLYYGHYQLLEIEAPDGYQSGMNELINIWIDGDDTGNLSIGFTDDDQQEIPFPEDGILKLENKAWDNPLAKRLVITKLDIDDLDTPLDDAVFSLYRWSAEDAGWSLYLEELITDYYGHIIVNEIPAGKYKLVETRSPDGYAVLETDTLFDIDPDEDDDYGAFGNTKYIELYNQAQGQIIVEKRDSLDREKKLEGAEFTLYYDTEFSSPGINPRSDDLLVRWEEIDSGVTDENGELIFSNLKPGRYALIQTKNPEGYRPIETPEQAGIAIISYIFDEEGEKVLFPVEQKIEVASEPSIGLAYFRKVDGDLYDPDDNLAAAGLSGAVFDLYHYDEPAHEWNLLPGQITVPADSDDGRFIIGPLAFGLYRLVETAAPDGYILDHALSDTETIFAVSEEETLSGTDIIIRNFKNQITGNLSLTKEDEETSAGLEGAVFDLEIVDRENQVYLPYQLNLISDENGSVHVRDMPAGTYRLTEKTAPDGYQMNDSGPVFFDLNADEMAAADYWYELIITNKRSESSSGNESAQDSDNGGDDDETDSYEQPAGETTGPAQTGDQNSSFSLLLVLLFASLSSIMLLLYRFVRK